MRPSPSRRARRRSWPAAARSADGTPGCVRNGRRIVAVGWLTTDAGCSDRCRLRNRRLNAAAGAGAATNAAGAPTAAQTVRRRRPTCSKPWPKSANTRPSGSTSIEARRRGATFVAAPPTIAATGRGVVRGKRRRDPGDCSDRRPRRFRRLRVQRASCAAKRRHDETHRVEPSCFPRPGLRRSTVPAFHDFPYDRLARVGRSAARCQPISKSRCLIGSETSAARHFRQDCSVVGQSNPTGAQGESRRQPTQNHRV